LAERQITPDEFADMVGGQTLAFERFGEPFGTEQFFEDKRVIWAFEGGSCQRGIWFANQEGNICFVYETNATSQCWSFLEMPNGSFHARLEGANPANDLIMTEMHDDPLTCALPDVGV